ncbi:hypothetical protein [Abyssogena phaseoliformis symbiont]|uniref:hypothetical protein n=1 Tax=Abyssogena phaseoliformis symbiont TaxID=596095 RepID=UPI001CED836C|nr:hypothetical protein [Abyssogena phaseoliformis symbiont]
MHQNLVPATNGRLVDVRELLPLDKQEYKDFGFSKSSHAQALFDDGKITKNILFSIKYQYQDNGERDS